MQVKRNTAVMLLIAFAIYFVHDIIPHHHHFDHYHTEDHHPVNHHHDGEHDNNNLSAFLSLIFHSGDGFTATINQNIVKHFNKCFDSIFHLSEGIEFAKFEIPPLIFYSPPESDQFIEFLACTKGLRAPPAFVS